VLYKLNRRVKIRRWDAIKNEFGGLEPTEIASWFKWAEVRASNWINLDLYNTRSGRPDDSYNQTKWEYDTTIILRYEKDRPTRSNDTIEYEGANYVINSITVNNEYSKNYEVIKCTKIDEAINSDIPMDNNTIQYMNYTAIGDEFVITDGNLIGKNIFLVLKDGVGFELLTSGTPSGKQVVFNSTNGTLTFGVTFATDEVITYIYF
jgi:hypothetical protein